MVRGANPTYNGSSHTANNNDNLNVHVARVDIPRTGLYVIQTANRRWDRYAGH
jgi:hypothetical protein